MDDDTLDDGRLDDAALDDASCADDGVLDDAALDDAALDDAALDSAGLDSAALDGAALDDDTLEPEDLTDEELGVGEVLTEAEQERARRTHRQARERWRQLPDDEPPLPIPVTPHTIGAVLRAARRHVRFNQRELAAAAGVSRSTVAGAESGAQTGAEAEMGVSTLVRLLEVTGLRLVVVDADGTHLAAPYARRAARDCAGRQLPAHLPDVEAASDHRTRYATPALRTGPLRVCVGRGRPARQSRGTASR